MTLERLVAAYILACGLELSTAEQTALLDILANKSVGASAREQNVSIATVTLWRRRLYLKVCGREQVSRANLCILARVLDFALGHAFSTGYTA